MKLPEMIRSFLKNDNVAFEYVYTVCGKYCINTLAAKRGCSVEDAEDLFIDAVLIVRGKLLKGEIEYLTNLKTYVYKICDNNYLARLKKENSKEDKQAEILGFLHNNDKYIDEDMVNASKYAWDQLSEKCKDIIYLFYVEAISMKEIAEHLDLSNSDTAKSTKSRCYKRFVEGAKEHYNKTKNGLK